MMGPVGIILQRFATCLLIVAFSLAPYPARAARHRKRDAAAAKASTAATAVPSPIETDSPKSVSAGVPSIKRQPIKKEEALAPKKEVGVDSSISKTKDLRPSEISSKGPGLNADQINQAKTEAIMDEKLDEEIQSETQLEELSTTCDDQSSARYNLADALWEKSKRLFFKANDFNTVEPDKSHYTAEMKDKQQQAVGLYQKIVDDCPNYGEISKILFNYGRSLMELERAKEASELFRRIIKEFPTSEWVPQAWFMVGEYYFNTVNDANAALKAYKKATEIADTPIFGFATYKQGWCYINVAEWELALRSFEEVVRISEDPKQPIDDHTRASLRKEAIKDYVRAYANHGEAKLALSKFRSVARSSEILGMLESLGNWYIGQGAHSNVVLVYHDLIKNFPKSTRLPVFQGRVVDAVSRLGSPKETVHEVKLLTEYFLALRERIDRNDFSEDQKNNVHRDAAEAEEIAENTIRRLATDYHKEAKKIRGVPQTREYELALELYKHYLEVFPKPKEGAEVNYVFFMRFYYADVLYRLEHFLEAATNYDMVVEMNPRPTSAKEKTVVLSAAEEAVRSYDEVVQDLDRKTPPEVSGNKPKPIPEVKGKLIAACKRYIDYVGSEGERIVEIRYKMARIYYTYNHFDEAAPAFDDIVKNHPKHQVACYAANLALDIYNGEKNYRSLKTASHNYLENKQLACGDEDRARFAKIEEQSSFFLIKSDYEEKRKYIAAGNAYMSFYKDYPHSEFADKAVYNAAVNYDLGNRLDKANEVRRFLVDTLPDSPLVPETLYNIAQSYERIVDFENASKFLDLFATRYPKDPRSKDAVYNSALYLATLHDFDMARKERLNYIRLYPNDPEVHNVAFATCESMETEGRLLEEAAKEAGKHSDPKIWADAHDCYFSWIKNGKYTSADPDLTCQAQWRRGEIMRTKTKYEKGAEEQRKTLLKMWPTWKKNGIAKVPRCAEAIAELQFRDLGWQAKKYTDLAISSLDPTPKGKKAFDASVKTKIVERDNLVALYKSVVELGVPRWALAALYQIGEAYRDSIDKLLSAPIPDRIPGYKLSAEDKGLLRQKLREMAAPIEASAVEAYKLCVTKANELGVYNKWSVRALDQLQKLRPQEYPLVVEKLVAVSLKEPLKLQENGIIIADGDELKPVRVNLAEPPKRKDEAAPAMIPPPPVVAPAGDKPASPPAKE